VTRDQEETFLSGQCVLQDLREFPEHQLTHAVDLIGVSHWLRRATHGQTTNFLPVEIGQCNRKRDLVVVRYGLRLLRFSRAPEIYSETVTHVADRCRLWIAVRADSCDCHIACPFEDREDFLSQGVSILHLRSEFWGIYGRALPARNEMGYPGLSCSAAVGESKSAR